MWVRHIVLDPHRNIKAWRFREEAIEFLPVTDYLKHLNMLSSFHLQVQWQIWLKQIRNGNWSRTFSLIRRRREYSLRLWILSGKLDEWKHVSAVFRTKSSDLGCLEQKMSSWNISLSQKTCLKLAIRMTDRTLLSRDVINM